MPLTMKKEVIKFLKDQTYPKTKEELVTVVNTFLGTSSEADKTEFAEIPAKTYQSAEEVVKELD